MMPLTRSSVSAQRLLERFDDRDAAADGSFNQHIDPGCFAAAAISVPWRAITALLAVTTDFPAAMA